MGRGQALSAGVAEETPAAVILLLLLSSSAAQRLPRAAAGGEPGRVECAALECVLEGVATTAAGDAGDDEAEAAVGMAHVAFAWGMAQRTGVLRPSCDPLVQQMEEGRRTPLVLGSPDLGLRRRCAPWACRCPGAFRARSPPRGAGLSVGRGARAGCAREPSVLHAMLRAVPPPPGTKWTRRVPHPVLIGHAASLSQVVALGQRGADGSAGALLACGPDEDLARGAMRDVGFSEAPPPTLPLY